MRWEADFPLGYDQRTEVKQGLHRFQSESGYSGWRETLMLTLGGLHVKNAAQREIWETGKSCDRPTHGFPAFQDNW
jgi:hypothetical protein